jgi:gamma-glutamylcyclotransferase
MLYFAYGSNLDWSQIRERCPSARFVCVGLLRDHELAFTRCSCSRECGVADALYEEGAEVWGVIYEIAETEVAMLDKSEGFQPGREQDKNAYVRKERHVYSDGDKEKPLLVHVYFANQQENPPRPSTTYKQLIVDGAIHWHLRTDYIDQLMRIETGD